MTHSDEIGKCVLKHPGTPRIHSAIVDNLYKHLNKTFIHSTQTFYKNIKELLNKVSYRWIVYFIAGSLESANSSILAAQGFFKEVVGKKSGFYVN